MHWYVVHSKPWQEPKVEARLNLHGIQTFLPLILTHPARKPRRGAVEPLFPGYLFVHSESDPGVIATVRWTPGVRYILSDGDRPALVEGEVVAAIRSRTNRVGYVEIGVPFNPGDRVRIANGPLDGLCGILERRAGRPERVRVLLGLVGVHVDIPWELLVRE